MTFDYTLSVEGADSKDTIERDLVDALKADVKREDAGMFIGEAWSFLVTHHEDLTVAADLLRVVALIVEALIKVATHHNTVTLTLLGRDKDIKVEAENRADLEAGLKAAIQAQQELSQDDAP